MNITYSKTLDEDQADGLIAATAKHNAGLAEGETPLTEAEYFERLCDQTLASLDMQRRREVAHGLAEAAVGLPKDTRDQLADIVRTAAQQ